MSDEINKRLEAIETSLAYVRNQLGLAITLSGRASTRISWQVKNTASGIQLGAATTVSAEGTLIGTSLMPTGPSQLSLVLIAKRDNGEICVVDGPYKIL